MMQMLATRPFELLTYEEVWQLEPGSPFVFDVECYPNFFMVAFLCLTTGKVFIIEANPKKPLEKQQLAYMLASFKLIGFNSRGYDLPMCALAQTNRELSDLHYASHLIITTDIKWYQMESEFNIKIPKVNHIDLCEVVPLNASYGASLKMRAAQMHFHTIQDLPFDPTKPLTFEQAQQIKAYCINDLLVTKDLYEALSEQLKLRAIMSKTYRTDLMSKSDAQIGEAVIGARLKKIKGHWPKKPKTSSIESVKYSATEYIRFKSPALQETYARILNSDFAISASGAIIVPPWMLEHKVKIGKATYQLGAGGLHSTEKVVAYKTTETQFIVDRDVASYYPAIILNQELYPAHLGRDFLPVYRAIVEERLEAKRSGNKPVAESLKIVINGSFGKFGSRYSLLYAPQLLIQTTITGQLGLLMLIEKLESEGIEIASANTDGIVMVCPQSKRERFYQIIAMWERIVGFTTEETPYRAYFARDVNNYVAIKEDGKIKGKGAYGNPWAETKSVDRFKKNPVASVCVEALWAFLRDRTPLEQTIRACSSPSSFAVVRKVKGGAQKGGQPIGKIVRWYYSTASPGPIRYIETGNAVADSENGQPMQVLPESVPADLDFQAYIKKAESMLSDVGFHIKKQTLLH